MEQVSGLSTYVDLMLLKLTCLSVRPETLQLVAFSGGILLIPVDLFYRDVINNENISRGYMYIKCYILKIHCVGFTKLIVDTKNVEITLWKLW